MHHKKEHHEKPHPMLHGHHEGMHHAKKSMPDEKKGMKEPEGHHEHGNPDHHHKAIKTHLASLHKMAKHHHKKHKAK